MFQYRSETKRDIQYIKLGIRVASRVVDRRKTQDLRKLGNIWKISNLCGDIAQCPVSLPEIKLQRYQSKSTQKQTSDFSCPVQFYWISLFCSKYFALDCSFLFRKSQHEHHHFHMLMFSLLPKQNPFVATLRIYKKVPHIKSRKFCYALETW